QPPAAPPRPYPPAGPTPRTPPRAPPPPPRLPRPAPVRQRRRTGPLLGVAAVALLAGGGIVYLLNGRGETPDPVRQDLRLALVEQAEAGACTDRLAPPTFYDEKAATCYRISTRDGDRMSVKQLKQVRTQFDTQFSVQVTFHEEDGRRFTALTEKAAGRQAPQNQIAIVLGD
ncbi:hypothetical protein ACFV5C_11385, partial [Streptomyces sp. NPDC059762]